MISAKLKIKLSNSSAALLKEQYLYILLTIIAVFMAWWISEFYKYARLVDYNSYVSIGLKYSKGNFSEAVNGYWSPLISWGLALLYLLKFDITVAGQIFFSICVAVNLMAVYFLLCQLNLLKIEKLIIFIISLFTSIYFAFAYKTPDLLSCATLLVYIAFAIIFYKNPSLKNGIKLGIIGALSYYTKYFNFPFFIVHFSLFSAVLVVTNKWSLSVLKSSIVSGLVFIILVLPWILILSSKYGHITFSTSGIFNTTKVSPEWKPHDGDIERVIGFLAPPNSTAFSSWEDPSYYPIKKWSPWESWESFKYNIDNIIYNLRIIHYSINYCSIFALLILILVVLQVLKKHILEKKIFYFLFLSILLVYSLGYGLVAAEERYFMPFYFLLLISGFLILNQVRTSKEYSPSILIGIYTILSISFLNMPVRNLFLKLPDTPINQTLYESSKKLSKVMTAESKFSSNGFDIPMFIAMYSNTRFYGCLPDRLDGTEVESEFKKRKINYYLHIGEPELKFLESKKLVFEDSINNIKLYKLNE